MDSLLTSKRLEDTVAKRLSDSRWDDGYGKMRDYEVNNAISKYFGVKQDGWIHQILAWLAKTFGFTNSMIGSKVSDAFANVRNRYGNSAAATPHAAQSKAHALNGNEVGAIQRTGNNIKSWFLGGPAPKAPSVPGVKNTNMS